MTVPAGPLFGDTETKDGLATHRYSKYVFDDEPTNVEDPYVFVTTRTSVGPHCAVSRASVVTQVMACKFGPHFGSSFLCSGGGDGGGFESSPSP